MIPHSNSSCPLSTPPWTDYTKLALTVANNVTLRLAVSNFLDSVFVYSIPLGGTRAYSDGTCPSNLDTTLTGDSGTQFGASIALSESGKTLVIGIPGTTSSPDASVLMVDISLIKKVAASPTPSASTGVLSSTTTSSAVALDNTYYQTNPSTVLVSARRGSIGVPAAQTFSLSSWAAGSPGGAPYSASSGYSISPNDPYMSGGTPVQNSIVSITSALQGLGLTTSAIKAAAAKLTAASTNLG